jgi:hypothetical protein
VIRKRRLKKCQNQDLEEQVTQTVEALEVVQTVLDEAIQFSLDPVALIIWLQDHRYWDLLWQHPIQLRSKQFHVCLPTKMWFLMDQLEQHNHHLDFSPLGVGCQVRCQWRIL